VGVKAEVNPVLCLADEVIDSTGSLEGAGKGTLDR